MTRRIFLSLLLLVVVAGCAWLPTQTTSVLLGRAEIDVLACAIVLVALLLVPLFSRRGLLQPRQFVTFATTPGSLALALALTGIIAWPVCLLGTWLASLWVTRTDWFADPPLTITAIVLVVMFAVLAVRVMSAVSGALLTDRGANSLRAIGILLLIAALPVAVFVVASGFTAEGATVLRDTSRMLEWTPFGAPFGALRVAAMGDLAGAWTRLAVTAAAVLLLFVVWFPIVRWLLQHVERPVPPEIARSGLGWFDRFSPRPAQAIAARMLTYWSRDPRYRVSLFAIPFAPIVMVVAFWVAGADIGALALVPVPVILLMLGWSQHNDVAMDSTAIWEHVASGTQGRADRIGRLVPIMLIGVPLALIGTSLSVTVFGDWRVLPAVLGLNLGVLLIASGVSSVFSVLLPYPVTRPGDSPFVQPQWSGSGSGTAQTLSMIVALLLSIAPAWATIAAVSNVTLLANVWALVIGIGVGLVSLAAGVLIGGRVFDRSGPELIAVTQVFD